MKRNFRQKLFCILAIVSYIAGSCITPGVLADTYHPSHLEILEGLSKKSQEQKEVSVSDFTDVLPTDWFYPYVDALCSDGIIKGVSDTSFAPQSTFSYAEACAVITRYLGLESEAKSRQAILAASGKTGHAEWYSGYIQLLYEAQILRDGTELFTADENRLCDIDTSVATSPIKRYEFADMISRSFELDESPIKAKNTYYETGGKGHEFISSGFYSDEIVGSYAEIISDYESIPDEYRKSVLKSYSNGIFCGDANGLFNPQSNLTRAEMAKVIATTTDFSLRTWAENANGTAFLSQSDYEKDGLGNTFLSKTASQKILEKVSNDIYISNGGLAYTRSSITPSGYCADVYVYSVNGSGNCTLIGQSTLHSPEKTSGRDIFAWYGNSGKVLVVLRNLTENSRPEAVMELGLSSTSITNVNFGEYAPVTIEKEAQTV